MNTNNGWKLVPVEPTEEMEQAAADYLGACVKAWGLWQAMLFAAPAAPGSPASTVADEGAKDERQAFEAWAVRILGDNPTWRESGLCELAWQAWQTARASVAAPAAGDALDAITLPIAAARMIRREYLPSNPRRMSHVAVRDAVEQFLCALQAAEAAIAAAQQGGE